jgi:hypothetical protein
MSKDKEKNPNATKLPQQKTVVEFYHYRRCLNGGQQGKLKEVVAMKKYNFLL